MYTEYKKVTQKGESHLALQKWSLEKSEWEDLKRSAKCVHFNNSDKLWRLIYRERSEFNAIFLQEWANSLEKRGPLFMKEHDHHQRLNLC